MPALSKAHSRRLPLFERLLPKQKLAVSAAVSQDGYALFLAQRTGKTWVTCGVMEKLDAQEVLIVGPKTNLVSTWQKTVQNLLPHYSVFFNFDDYLIFRKEWEKAWGDTPCHAVLLLNYEAINPKLLKRLRKRKWTLIAYDEAQRLKKRTSTASKNAAKLSSCAEHRLALTGTPQDKHALDLWAIFRFVDPTLLHGDWKVFEEEYIRDMTRGLKLALKEAKGMVQRKKILLQMRIIQGKPKFKPGMERRFFRRIEGHSMSLTKKDAGITPAKITYVPVHLFGKQRRAYDQLENTMVVDVGKLTLTTALKITRNVKLQQITGGYIKDEDGRVRLIGDAKLRKFELLIKKLKPPVAIFAKHTYEIEMILEVLADYSDKVGVVWGRVKDGKVKKPRTATINAFQNGELDYVVCQQRTGGVGVDLFKSRLGIVFSMGHSWIDYDQMMSRLDFLNQEERAEFFLLFCLETIDADIITALEEKCTVSEVTLRRLKHKLIRRKGQ